MRKRYRGSRLFRKYFSAFVAILLSSFLFLGSALLVLSRWYWSRDKLSLLSENTDRTAGMVSLVYAQDQAEPQAPHRQQVIQALLVSTYEMLGADFFLCDTAGRVIGCRDTVPDTLLPAPVLCPYHGLLRIPESYARQALLGSLAETGTLAGAFQEDVLVAADPFTDGDGNIIGFVMAAQPMSLGLGEYQGGIMRLFLLSALSALAVTFLVVYYISYRLARPLQEMARATKQYAKGDFSYRVDIRNKNELSLLAESFNSMAISLATLESSRRSFVANVSHELKTPMTTIGGFIDGMLDGTIPPKKHEHYLKVVSDEVQRLSRLVTGMLNLSKIENGDMKLNPTAFDINELLFHTVLSFEQLIARKGIELVGLEQLQPIILRGDKDMLYQVFYNLIDNAVKFTPPGERIEFYVQIHSTDRPGGGDPERIFCFGLRNTGVGIASEELTRIFERFYKADQSRSYDVKGAGLGLYLVKTIVEMHGGQMKADSDSETYTEFAVLLPAD
ncbi:MAG: HAMP domain-containing histidine kinase [Oscillospiraceae bacterium]|nr:HAMP domain-containing histidine kinase [Oscillospiraceae bacterium]